MNIQQNNQQFIENLNRIQAQLTAFILYSTVMVGLGWGCGGL